MSTLEAHVLEDHAPLQVCHLKIKRIQVVGLICHHGASKDIPRISRMDIGYQAHPLIAKMLNEFLRGSPQRCKNALISLLMCYNVFILKNKIDARVFKRTCVNLYYILFEIVLICVNFEEGFLLVYMLSRIQGIICMSFMQSSQISESLNGRNDSQLSYK